MKRTSYPNALGVVAVSYLGADYFREILPGLHEILRPVIWGFFAVAIVFRALNYEYWTQELGSIGMFVSSLVFMVCCLFVEAAAMQYVTTVLGMDWHWNTAPLPDSGQWTVLFSNEKLPEAIVALLREPVIGLHHYLMLFLLLAFSVLYGCVKAPGMGLGARYMFTMACGRLIRVSTFTATILPSARPWCAQARFRIANHPHPWAQKYYVPYSKDPRMIQQIITRDEAFASLENYPAEYVPNWGSLQFLVNILRPMDPAKTGQPGYDWFNTFKNSAAGGCNDLMFSGHVFVAVVTAAAWQEAYPGWTSILIWLLVVHSAQREIRERHHYSVDVVTGVYIGIFLWRTTGWIWSSRDQQEELKFKLLAAVEDDIQKAAEDGNLQKIRCILNKVSTASKDNEQKDKVSNWFTMLLGSFVLFMTLGLGLLTFTWTANG